MNMLFHDSSFLAGVPLSIKTITNLPPGATVTFKFSKSALSIAFVKTQSEWAAYDLQPDGDDNWKLGYRLEWEKLAIPVLCPGCGQYLPHYGVCGNPVCTFPAIG